jgi:hypothetical protein
MTGTDWQRIEDIFHKAVDLTSDDRSAFLDAACSSDEELRRRVESLLAGDTSRDGLLHAVVANAADGLPTESSIAGKQIGPYR